MHGVEGNYKTGDTDWYSPEQSEKALRFAEENNLIKTAGTDFHKFHHTPGTGLVFPEEIKDSGTLISFLKDGNYDFAKSSTFDKNE